MTEHPTPNPTEHPTPQRTPRPTVLMDGIAMGESPRWYQGRLWLADWGAQQLVAVDESGASEVMAAVASLPFCIDPLPDGRLALVASEQRSLLVRGADGGLEPLADLRPVSDRPWNEVVSAGGGAVYVNGIGFEFGEEEPGPGLIALVTPDGTVREVAADLAFPNGMAVTPDGRTLLVAESYGAGLTAFDIEADGTLARRRVWADLNGDNPDGICLDADGALWYGDVGNKRCVRVREGGEVLQVIDLDRGCFACVLGGPDRRTLYMVVNEWGGVEGMGGTRKGLALSVDVDVPGAGWP